MKKIALPLSGNNLCQHFGHSKYFKVFEIHNNKVIQESIIEAPVHQPGVLPNWLVDMEVTDIITSGIGHKAIEIFNQNKINVFVGVETKDVNEIISDYLLGTLVTDGNLCTH